MKCKCSDCGYFISEADFYMDTMLSVFKGFCFKYKIERHVEFDQAEVDENTECFYADEMKK